MRTVSLCPSHPLYPLEEGLHASILRRFWALRIFSENNVFGQPKTTTHTSKIGIAIQRNSSSALKQVFENFKKCGPCGPQVPHDPRFEFFHSFVQISQDQVFGITFLEVMMEIWVILAGKVFIAKNSRKKKKKKKRFIDSLYPLPLPPQSEFLRWNRTVAFV